MPLCVRVRVRVRVCMEALPKFPLKLERPQRKNENFERSFTLQAGN